MPGDASLTMTAVSDDRRAVQENIMQHNMTRNRMRVAIQSGCVPKILALKRWSKNDFPQEFQARQMHSFPIVYNTMGSKVDGLGVRDHFLPKMA